jgi:hypothetical protein
MQKEIVDWELKSLRRGYWKLTIKKEFHVFYLKRTGLELIENAYRSEDLTYEDLTDLCMIIMDLNIPYCKEPDFNYKTEIIFLDYKWTALKLMRETGNPQGFVYFAEDELHGYIMGNDWVSPCFESCYQGEQVLKRLLCEGKVSPLCFNEILSQISHGFWQEVVMPLMQIIFPTAPN